MSPPWRGEGRQRKNKEICPKEAGLTHPNRPGSGGIVPGPGPYARSGVSDRLSRSRAMARRSMRDTCNWLTPSTRAARSWVRFL